MVFKYTTVYIQTQSGEMSLQYYISIVLSVKCTYTFYLTEVIFLNSIKLVERLAF